MIISLRDVPKTLICGHLGLWRLLGTSRGKTRQTIVGIKVVYDTLGHVRRNRRNLGCQFVLPTASRFKNSKK